MTHQYPQLVQILLLGIVLLELRQLRKEVHRMNQQDAALVQAVTDLTTAVTDNGTAMSAEIANLEAQITPGDDPVIDSAISNLKSLTTQLNQSTAAAQAAIAPPAGTDGGTTESSTV